MLGGKKVKVNGIAGAMGFVLSFIVGIISGGSFLMVLLRAFIFGAFFFVFMEVSQRLIGTFLPELLNPDEDASSTAHEAPGSRVDISVEAETDKERTDLFDVSIPPEQKDLASRGDTFIADGGGDLDQEHKKDYTQQKEVEVDNPTGFVPSAPGSMDITQEIAEMDPLFSTNEVIPKVAPSKAQSNSRVPNMRENLDPRKMASAIQTILKQE
ncbi:hypothetical protein Holit_00722 [Hollandina sp. SP2]